MKIIRNGKEIELTDPELADACMEYARLCHRDDINSYLYEWCEANKIPREKIDDNVFNEIIDEYEGMLWHHEEDHREALAEEAASMYMCADDYREE